MMENKEPYLPVHIANYLLSLADQEGAKDMTLMKLMKLVYFSYAWYLTLSNEKLFTEEVEAWQFGPVIPSLYHEFKHFGNRHITEYAAYYEYAYSDEPQYLMINGADKNVWGIVAAVWQHYKDKSATELSRITHDDGSPWDEVYISGHNKPLKPEKIRERAQQAIDEYLQQYPDAA